MRVLYEDPGKVTLEGDSSIKLVLARWKSLNGPHYRRGVDAMLGEVRKNGVRAYISDASQATDVQTQEDLHYLQTVATKTLLEAGLKLFIVVVPASAIAKMGAKRISKLAGDSGVEHHQVASLDEALLLARGEKAA